MRTEIKITKDGRKVELEKADGYRRLNIYFGGTLLENVSACVLKVQSGAAPHRIGNIGLTSAEASRVKALFEQWYQPQVDEATAARIDIERMFDAAEDCKDSDYSKFIRLDSDARQAYKKWQAKYPEAAAKEKAEQQAEQARKDAQNANAVARKLRGED